MNSQKNKLIESCLRSMWSCVLSKPSLKPYPLKFASNLQLNREIQSKNIKIAKEFLGNNDDCDSIGYFIWPSLIRCDTNELLHIPITACYTNFDVIILNKNNILQSNIKPNHQITSEDQKGAKTEQHFSLAHFLFIYFVILQFSFNSYFFVKLAEQLNETDVAKRHCKSWCYYILFCIADSAYEVAYGEIIDKKNIKNVSENIQKLVLQNAKFDTSAIQPTKLKSI
ncbi:hypothetical protein RFI_36268 [Reticulomyxa filosa]|uniref:Uncharacterized protein n=1 Tax=Reticulomyxa filosa TaxID=46433 RepID=X6LIG3_RETFI|nr:hypothetical protein RFI_36268 [Reticulomyxa filosa]|eukprot:ETO01171.1 hypothetical protein RFI_36268 [Reticulomyxa filosa]